MSLNKERILGSLAVLGTLFFVVHLFLMSGRRVEAVPFTLLLAITALAPVALWWWLLSRRQSQAVRPVMTYVGLGVFAVGFVIYYRGGFVHFDGLYAIVFIFFPALQILALGLIYLLARVATRKIRKD